MNIGIFTDTYFPQINGVVTSVRMLERELEKLGHKVYIFTTSNPDVHNPLPRVFRLPSMPFAFLPAHRVTMMYPPKLLLSIKKLKLDVIHTQTEFPIGIFGRVVSEFLKIPSVHTYHTMYEDYVHYIANGHLITPKMAQKYSRVFCNRAGTVIAPTEKTKASLLDYGVIRPIVVIPTGLDFKHFYREQYSQEQIQNVKKELGLALTDPVVINVGRVAKEKSLDIVIQEMPAVLEKLPAAKLVIIGDGPWKHVLEELVQKIGVASSVIFAGARPWDSIGLYYQLGDVFVAASTSETQGLTYIEAMAANLPVIAKKDEVIAGIIEYGVTGYYFEDNHDLADLLYSVLVNKEQSAKVAQQGFESIQHLSSEKFAKAVEQVYLDVTANYLRKSVVRKLWIKKQTKVEKKIKK